jgi:YD repeat-containing protein
MLTRFVVDCRPRVLFAALALVSSLTACGGTDENTDESTGSLCQVTVQNGERSGGAGLDTLAYDFDEDARQLTAGRDTYDLDEHDRVVKVYDPEWSWTFEYDEQGNLLSDEHYLGGVRSHTNVYADGRLTHAHAAARRNQTQERISYFYDDPEMPNAWTRQEIDMEINETVDHAYERTFAAGKVHTVTSITRDGIAFRRWTYSYDGDTLVAIERDSNDRGQGAFDGTTNIRYEWEREGNRVTRFTQDGNDAQFPVFTNDAADYEETYGAGCQPLLDRFSWLAHEPGPESFGHTSDVISLLEMRPFLH